MAVTPESILATYADQVAAVVKQPPATELGPFAMQVYAAGEELQAARVADYQLLDIAAAHLFDVLNAAPEPRPQSLANAAHFLTKAADAVAGFLTRA
ncbi:hypothetical protein ABZ135_01390 [Streptomyces sp. NPDC006339]|uniref:hypothetical protein n=1 Tax=Streptomyces sp. NPDC006339 TaxID=3156755 RepID=UPI0033B18BBE